MKPVKLGKIGSGGSRGMQLKANPSAISERGIMPKELENRVVKNGEEPCELTRET